MRKNAILPDHLDALQFEAIFYSIKKRAGSSQAKRVEEILGLLSELGAGLGTLDRMRVITRLRNILAIYRWATHVSPTSEGFRAILYPADRGHMSRDDDWEYQTVRALLEYVPYVGERSRIRRCAEAGCREWFFAAKRDRHEFCSGNCRQRDYDTRPEMRERKKLKMREHRVREKERDQNRKKSVGFRGTAKRRVRASVATAPKKSVATKKPTG